VLAPESIAEMQKIQTGNAQLVFIPKQSSEYGYGLGNWIGPAGQFMNPALSGGWAYIDPSKNLAVVIIGEMKGKEDLREPYLKIVAAAQ
jgi:CubicO group peptidase (beta-lactamase class C family)